MKKTLLAGSLVLAGTASPALADYFTNINITSGYAQVSGYSSGDDTPTYYTYQLLLRDLDGTVSIQTPSNAYSPYTVYAMGTASADVTPLIPGSEVNVNLPTWTPIYTGSFTHTGLTLPSYSFSFTPGTLGVLGPALAPISFSFDYNGNTTPPVLAFINSIMTALGLPTFTSTAGSGTMAISGMIHQDGALLNITESNLTWTGIGGLLKLLDTNPAFNPPNVTDMTFSANMQLRFVPEPATLGLLGLGLLGLAAARRRQSV